MKIAVWIATLLCNAVFHGYFTCAEKQLLNLKAGFSKADFNRGVFHAAPKKSRHPTMKEFNCHKTRTSSRHQQEKCRHVAVSFGESEICCFLFVC